MRRYSTMNDANWDASEVIHRLGLSHIGEFGHKAYLAKVLDMKRRLLFYFICHNVLPKESNKHAIRFSDMYFIDKMEQGCGPHIDGVSLASIIIGGMQDTI